MFTILYRTAYGWTDYIGTGENSWANKAEADDAIEKLRADAALESGMVTYADNWKAVPTEDLDNCDLIA